MIKRKQTEGFNLAFLDIMSCGLGAIILVFMLIKHNVNESSVEVTHLNKDIQQLETQKQVAQQQLNTIQKQLAEQSRTQQIARQSLEAAKSTLTSTSAAIATTTREIESLKSDIKTIKVLKKDDLIATKHVNEEQYLIGLQVKGQKIAILVDHSASMTHEKLIDIIKTKNASNQQKQQARKWIRTKRIVRWLLARSPKKGDVITIAFNDKAQVLGHKGWVKASAPTSIPAILTDLNTLVPEGATNLQLALQLANKFSPSNVYLITDGLPTQGESRYKSLNPFARCSSLRGNSKIISGACRVKLFQQTIAETATKNVQTNVILLPLEGDPDAIDQYWGWTAVSGGLVLNPASNWP